ncbi:hypothetical protein PTKIN_Ptkin01aG0296500 [Pterospermum kingtungense]
MPIEVASLRKTISWDCPPEGTLKFYIDGSALEQPGLAGIGGILRDDNSRTKIVFSKSIGVVDSNFADLLAIREALTLFISSSTWVNTHSCWLDCFLGLFGCLVASVIVVVRWRSCVERLWLSLLMLIMTLHERTVSLEEDLDSNEKLRESRLCDGGNPMGSRADLWPKQRNNCMIRLATTAHGRCLGILEIWRRLTLKNGNSRYSCQKGDEWFI